MPKVLVIGARRRRQGIGEFVGRYFLEAGAQICAIVGTTTETASGARKSLVEAGATGCRAYVDLGKALSQEAPDIVAVCSPYANHRQALLEAADHGAHCLCDKPLWWEVSGEDFSDRVAETSRVVKKFTDRRLHLALITQWPFTLAPFYELFPQAHGERVEQFDMELSPITTGEEMVLDSAPHPLSMLQELLGCGDIANVQGHYLDVHRRQLIVDFDYLHQGGITGTRLQLETCENSPRPAAYAINGMRVRRRVKSPDYRLWFETDERELEIEDPLRMLVAQFVSDVASGALPQSQRLVEGIRHLETLYSVARSAKGASPKGRTVFLSANLPPNFTEP